MISLLKSLRIGFLFFLSGFTGLACSEEPVFQPTATPQEIASWLRSTEWVRSLDEKVLLQLLPEQSGLRYVDCPHCEGGRQENQLEWSPESPEEISCKYCNHRYPSPLYPEHHRLVVRTPSGGLATYPYWQDKKGYRHFFQARRDDEKRAYFAERARELAFLFWATKEETMARRATLILDRFAEVFPNWCYHFDYPHRQKEIVDGNVNPSQFRPGFRTSRWTWWAYSDIPVPLLEAFDLVRTSRSFDELSSEKKIDIRKRIEVDLIRNACEQVIANQDDLTNMSPRAWGGLVRAGRILREPRFVHEPIRRLGRLVDSQFFYDGSWSEGSPDYGRQSLQGLESVIALVRGYSDPVGYRSPETGDRLDDVDLLESFPSLSIARETLSKLRLPNGRPVPVHDTWSTSQLPTLDESTSYLLPALGHACLGSGRGENQIQFHLTWSGGYGHSHADHLSLLLFSHGRERLSDLGYTHTAYRAWTLATAAHNTVVIDGRNQSLGKLGQPTDGELIFFNRTDPRIQVVRASGVRGYAGIAKKYQRSFIVVDAGHGNRYAVDLFEVEGGKQHDYFLHGDADVDSLIASDLPLTMRTHLGIERNRWIAPKHEGETSKISEPYYAYGFLNDLQQGRLHARTSNTFDFLSDTKGDGVRVTLLPSTEGEVILGKNPSIRRAGEDDSKLDAYQRPFLLWRQSADQQASPFVAVLEPYRKATSVRSIERLVTGTDAVGIKIDLGDRTDYLLLNAQTAWHGRGPSGELSYRGDIGFLSIRSNTIEHYYSIGEGGWTIGQDRIESHGVRESIIQSIVGNELVLIDSELPLPSRGEIVRIITEDGWVYPFHVQSARRDGNATKLRVVEPLSMAFDHEKKLLYLRSFPQREHRGEIRLQWLEAVHSH